VNLFFYFVRRTFHPAAAVNCDLQHWGLLRQTDRDMIEWWTASNHETNKTTVRSRIIQALIITPESSTEDYNKT